METDSEDRVEHIAAAATQIKRRPLGELVVPAIICGAVGAVLTIILGLVGRYVSIDLTLKEYYMGEPFYLREWSAGGVHAGWDWLLAVVFTFGVSFAVLDTDKIWRRVMLILLFSVVLLMASPVLMLWDVFWSPVLVFVGVLWSWMCAFIYSCQHVMPCELLLPARVKGVDEECVDGEEDEGGDVSVIEGAKAEKVFSAYRPVDEDVDKKFQPKEMPTCPD